MRIGNSRAAFGIPMIVLHWVLALIIVGASAWAMHLIYQESTDANRARYIWGIQIHKSFGLLAFALIAVRISWVLLNPGPRLLARPGWELTAARAARVLLYALLIVVPLSGWLSSSSFGGKTTFFDLFLVPNIWPKDREMIKVFHATHKYSSFALLGLSAAHMAAALWHHYVLKDETLRRMIPGLKPRA